MYVWKQHRQTHNSANSVWGRVDRGECEQGVMLHDCVEGVVVRGGGGTRERRGGPHGGAHVFGPHRRQPQRLRRPGLRVQRAPQVQHLHHTSSSQYFQTL